MTKTLIAGSVADAAACRTSTALVTRRVRAAAAGTNVTSILQERIEVTLVGAEAVRTLS
jgi:hypothetical protein